MMETLTDRITRYLLKRLRRRAVLTLYQRAVDAGLLTSVFIGGEEHNGTSWRVADQVRYVLTGKLDQDRRAVARMMGTGRAPLQHGDGPVIFIVPDEDAADGVVTFECQTIGAPEEQPAGKTRKTRRVKAGGRTVGTAPNTAFSYVAALLREHIPSPNPVHAAVALLVARAVGSSLPDFAALVEALRPAAPFVLLKAPIPNFELCLGMMLEDGLILPFRAALEDVLRESILSGRHRHQSTVIRRKVKTLSGVAVGITDDRDLRRQLRQTLLDEPAPILLADETVSALTPVVTETTDLVLECTGIDREMIAELLQICAGIPPKQSFAAMDDMAFDPAGLTLDDIALAVRPGRSAEQTLSILAMLIERLATEGGDERDGKDAHGRTRRSGKERAGSASSRSKEAVKKKPQEVGVEVVEPVAVNAVDGDASANTSAGKPTTKDRLLSVETLAGYGPARDWALDLKADLMLWRAEKLRWDEMSTKLLLSGPPGTGKTTFARALCNTLQVPLLVTSVAHWLEPGYLGEVLRRMSGSFTVAGDRAPAILFIDEIDNIGMRQGAGSREHDDYWTSLINRMLELLDGASRSEGVIIVGATNLPDKIDPAILRSGRLETHARIPMPDVETLIGILGHHLGADLDAVLASAPATATTTRRLRPPTPVNGKPPVRRESVQKPQPEKGPRHD